jgi:hypothetical protein
LRKIFQHLDILRSALDLMEDHLPTRDAGPGNRFTDCSICGYCLSNHGASAAEHATFVDVTMGGEPCKWLRAIAELSAWIRVEEEIEANRPAVAPVTLARARELLRSLEARP